MRVKRRPQLSNASVQSLLLLAQGVELLLFAVEPGAESCRLTENVNLRCTLLIPQVRDLPLQFLEEVFQSDSPLTFHVVVQVPFLEGFQLFRTFDRGAGDRLSARDSLLLATVLVVAVLTVAIVLVGSFARIGDITGSAAARKWGVRTGNAGRRYWGEIVWRVAIGLAWTGLRSTGWGAMMCSVFVIGVATAMMVCRGGRLGLLADLVCHPILQSTSVTWCRIGR